MLENLKNPKNPQAHFIFPHQPIRLPALYTLSLKMAAWLEENRVTCLAFCLPNGLTNLLAYLGGWAADVTVMPINPRLTSTELCKLLQQYRPSHCWVSAEKIDQQFTATCNELGIYLSTVDNDLLQDDGPLGQVFALQTPVLQPTLLPQNGIIQFTSGTLGEYKGAMHSYQQCAVYAKLMAPDLQYQPNDHLLIGLSFNHAMAFSYQLLPALYLGLSCVILPSFDIDAVLTTLETHAITSLSLLPTMAYLLAKAARSSNKKYPHLRQIIIAGDALPLAMRQEIIAAFDCEPVVGIGMTESFGYSLNHNPQQKLGAAGLPVAGFTFKVVTPDYEELPQGETGEILIQGPGLFTEYYQLPALTKSSFHDGWFKTGDLGMIDSEGHLWFRGRRKHLIISGGSNIAPLEIEAAIYEHPEIIEAVVVGAPDPIYIEIGVAFVATTPNSTLNAAELKQFLATRLANYKLPQLIYFLDSLPKNVTGKLDRAVLTEKAKQAKTYPRPLIMGICNLTHDSFTEKGKGMKATSRCFDEIQNLVAAGAHIIDIGAESTRKDAAGLDEIKEIRLLKTILDELHDKRAQFTPFPLISIDTRKIGVMTQLLAKYPWIWIINDVEGSDFAQKAQLIAKYPVKYVLTHNLGILGRTAYLPKESAIADLVRFFSERIAILKNHGVQPSQIYLDVGFGFGKDSETAQIILQNLPNIKSQLELPLLIGHSRKPSVLGVSKHASLEESDTATQKLSAWLTNNGADILRVHKV